MYCGWKGYKSQNCIAMQRGLYCDWAQLGAGLGRWAQQARVGGAGQAHGQARGRQAQAGARAAGAGRRAAAGWGARQQAGARGSRLRREGERQVRGARQQARARGRAQARAGRTAWAWLGAGCAAWARGLAADCALGALGPFSIRFDSVFSRVNFFGHCS